MISVPVKVNIIIACFIGASECYIFPLFSTDFLFIRRDGVPSYQYWKSSHNGCVRLTWTVKTQPNKMLKTLNNLLL